MGMPVTLDIAITEVKGRAVSFEIAGRDSVEPICRGRHQRFVVDVATTGEGSVKVSEVIEALFGDIPFSSVRAELGKLDGDRIVSPLELESLRVAPAPVETDTATALSAE